MHRRIDTQTSSHLGLLSEPKIPDIQIYIGIRPQSKKDQIIINNKLG